MSKKQTKIKGPMTAAEVMEMLNNDADYKRRIAENDARLEKIWDERRKEQEHIIAELKDVGIHAASVWDMEPNPSGIPILLKHLKKSYSDHLEESIARALNMPEAMAHWDYLLDLFENGSEERAGRQTGLACTLSEFARKTKRYDDAMRILRKEELGDDRIFFLEVLALSRDLEIRARLKEFSEHPTLGEQARWYLKNPGRRSK